VEFHNNTVPPTESSCRHASNVFTTKLQVTLFADVSVPVHVTVVVPSGNAEPEGGVHATLRIAQLSLETGVG
jgi:hypothetical protein